MVVACTKSDCRGPGDLTPGDPLVIKMKWGKQEKEVELIVETGATFSVLNKMLVPVGNEYVRVRGATGQSEIAYFCKSLKYKYGKQWGIHKFLYMPNSPDLLLGKDLLGKLEATILFKN